MRDSCNSAGFDVQDVSSPAFFEETLSSGSFDVAMFGWIGFGGATDASSTFTTSGGNNVGSYSNPEVDRLIATLDVTTDATAQRELMSQLDTILWTDLASIPLFALPGFVAHTASLDGVTFQPTAFGVTWNLPEWERAR